MSSYPLSPNRVPHPRSPPPASRVPRTGIPHHHTQHRERFRPPTSQQRQPVVPTVGPVLQLPTFTQARLSRAADSTSVTRPVRPRSLTSIRGESAVCQHLGAIGSWGSERHGSPRAPLGSSVVTRAPASAVRRRRQRYLFCGRFPRVVLERCLTADVAAQVAVSRLSWPCGHVPCLHGFGHQDEVIQWRTYVRPDCLLSDGRV